jgi:hypothetical protein
MSRLFSAVWRGGRRRDIRLSRSRTKHAFAGRKTMKTGPIFKFTEAISFVVNCDSQDEVDYYRETLSVSDGRLRLQASFDPLDRSIY